MAKHTMQDVVPPEKRSIRNITIDKAKRTRSKHEALVEEVREDTPASAVAGTLPPRPPHALFGGNNEGGKRNGKRRFSRVGAWSLAGGAVALVLFVVFSSLFADTTVAVQSRQKQVGLDASGTASSQASASALSFEVMRIEAEASREVSATGEEQLDRKAAGTIIIYNNFDGNSQRLIKNTRFESPTGLIYRIPESVTVPGRTTNESGEVVPGSIEAEVFADTSGEEYNIDLTDFTVPGFKNDTARYNKFFARSKTAMAGGFSGVVKTATESDVARARTDMERELRETLLRDAHAQVPVDFLLFDDGFFITFTELPNSDADKRDRVLVRQRAVLHGVLFDRSTLAEYVAIQTIPDYDGNQVAIRNPEELTFRILNKEAIAPAAIHQFDFSLEGQAVVAWTFDEERLKNDLAGKARRDTNMIFSGYAAVERAEVVIRPFWKSSLPNNADRIEIKESGQE